MIRDRFKFKKAISPVVATALLLVVAVVAVVGFQSWFGTYSSNIYVESENKASMDSPVSIETIAGNKLYINGGDENVSIIKVSVDGVDCNINENISGIEGFSLSSCLSDTSDHVHEIVVVSDSQVVSKKVYIDDSQISSTSSSFWCYQESADVATVCGGLGTGSYVNHVTHGFGHSENIHDGDLDTYGYLDSDGTLFNFTYTIPEGANSNSKLQVKDYFGLRNLSISDCNLEEQTEVKFSITGDFYIASNHLNLFWNCWNGTNSIQIFSYLGSDVDFSDMLPINVYEEAMWWNIQN